LLDDEASGPGEVDADDCASLGFHTILFFFGGVVVDIGAASFGFRTILFFIGGGEMDFGASSFEICLFLFCFGLFLIYLLMGLLTKLPTG